MLKNIISPKLYQRFRYWWWSAHYYWPRQIARIFVHSGLRIEESSEDQNAQLLRKNLGRVNVLAPTRMCKLFTKYGSDKGEGWHNYTTVYSLLFNKLWDRPLRILEIGLGTGNPQIAFNMGKNAKPGASLYAWRQSFPEAMVYGADIDRAILFKDDRIETYYCDQTDRDAIKNLWSQVALRSGVDIIIDDGLHTFEANSVFLEESLSNLNDGGIYIIEDIYPEDFEKWRSALKTVYAGFWSKYYFLLVALPSTKNRVGNNNILVIGRSTQSDLS